jgi:hypothetical protein
MRNLMIYNIAYEEFDTVEAEGTTIIITRPMKALLIAVAFVYDPSLPYSCLYWCGPRWLRIVWQALR